MEEIDEHEEEEIEYCDNPTPVPVDPKATQLALDFAQVRKQTNIDGTIKTIIKARKSTFVSKLLYLNGAPFSFEGRSYLMPIYDGVDKNILLKTGRQVEKCVASDTLIQTTDNSLVEACSLKTGDKIWGWDFKAKCLISQKVVASESNGLKTIIIFDTFSGKHVGVTENHPIWARKHFEEGNGSWIEAGELNAYYEVLNVSGNWDRIKFISVWHEEDTWAIQTSTETLIVDDIVTHNTTFLGNQLVVDSAVVPYNKALYVSPSHSQTRQFSNEKLKPAIEQSPLIRRYLQSSSVSTQVFEKGFTNGSYVFLRSAFRTADRARGISARNLMLDEIQDFIGSEIPVIMECTSHFEDARVLMAGTPKSFDNPIEDYWQESTQCEWLVPCSNCIPRYWNFLDEKNMAPTDLYITGKLPPGPVCKRCMRPIDPSIGQWMTLSPGKRIKGYRISQLQVPWLVKTYDQWVKVLWKRDNYPFGQFYNEVLGLSFDNASKPITRNELIECCDNTHKMLVEFPTPEEAHWGRSRMLVGGIDWGEGNDGSDKSPTGKVRHASYSVFTIGMYMDQKRFKVMYVKKYTGQQTDPDFVVRDVARLCTAYDVKLVGVDWGHGWGVNNQLVRMLGPTKVVQFQYMPKMKHKMKWDPIGFRYQLQRNLILSELFFMLKDKRVVLPAWKIIEPFAKDILAVFVEYVEYRREMKYDHKTSEPDDWLHSLNYCHIASLIYLGRVPRS